VLERLLIAGALVAAILLVIAAGRRWYTWRNARIDGRLRAQAREAGTSASDASTQAGGRPRIVYFTTQTCVVCKAQQEPAIAALLQRRDDVVVERHDAVEERGIADEYGILSVPTTAVYDAAGQLVNVNRGFAPASLLLAQVSGADPSFDGGTAMPSEPLR